MQFWGELLSGESDEVSSRASCRRRLIVNDPGKDRSYAKLSIRKYIVGFPSLKMFINYTIKSNLWKKSQIKNRLTFRRPVNLKQGIRIIPSGKD